LYNIVKILLPPLLDYRKTLPTFRQLGRPPGVTSPFLEDKWTMGKPWNPKWKYYEVPVEIMAIMGQRSFLQVQPLGLKKPDKQAVWRTTCIMYPNVVHVFSGLS